MPSVDLTTGRIRASVYRDAVEFIKVSEGFEESTYLCSKKKKTVGYGTRLPITKHEFARAKRAGYIKRVGNEVELDEAAASELLDIRLREFLRDLRQRWPFDFTHLPPNCQIAALDMSYNMGVDGLLGFKNMIEAMRKRDYELAAKEAHNSDWRKQVKSRAPRVMALIASAGNPLTSVPDMPEEAWGDSDGEAEGGIIGMYDGDD